MRAARLVVLALLTAPTLAPDSNALPCAAWSETPGFRGALEIDREPLDVAVDGPYAYVVSVSGQSYEHTFLNVVDLTDPSAPALISTLEVSSDWVSGVAVTEGRLYVTYRQIGLDIVDVSDPLAPEHAAFLPVPTAGLLFDVAPVGNVAYVAASEGLHVVDVTDPADPVIVTTVPVDIPQGLHVDGTRMLAVASGMLAVLDLTDPLAPAIVAEHADLAGADVGGVGSFAYVVRNHASCIDPDCHCIARWSGLQTVDLTDPLVPVLGPELDLGPEHCQDLRMVGDRLYVFSEDAGAWALDVSSPSEPVIVHELRTYAAHGDVIRAEGQTIVCALSRRQSNSTIHELQLYDLTDEDFPDPSGDNEPRAATYDVAVRDDTAYTISQSYAASCGFGIMQCWTVRSHDVSDPSDLGAGPTWQRCYTGYGFAAMDLEVSNGDLYATGPSSFEGLYRFDLSGSSIPDPEVVFGGAQDIEPVADLLYLAQYARLGVLDTSGDPPTELTSLPEHRAERVASSGERVVTLGSEGPVVTFRTLDASDPASPQYVGATSWTDGAEAWIAIDGDLAAAGGDDGTVRVIDVSDLTDPQVVAITSLPVVDSVLPIKTRYSGSLRGSVLYVTDGAYGVAGFDLTVPAEPRFLGLVSTELTRRALARDDCVLVCGDGTLAALPPACLAGEPVNAWPIAPGAPPAARLDLRCTPNPFDARARLEYVLPGPSPVRLEIFDVRGARVRTLVWGERPAGRSTVGWDGRAADGLRAAPGSYFVRLHTPSGLVAERVVLLR